MSLSLPCALLLALAAQAPPADLNDMAEKAMKEAVRKVAPSVVQILTQGGADQVVVGAKGLTFRKALGPTTGVIVGADGYVVSSAFNFVNNPTAILVAVPGHKEPYLAKRVATDRSRMLTLLKIDAKDLPVPAGVPRKELRVGQWAIALGRTLDAKRDHLPAVSVGIISALDRVWGKAIQTDAKISPINYGGPLVDVQGRVQGILVPASPNGEDETAGFEWYDSGIGFAIPMEDVTAVLPRLKEGKDLKKGLLGVRMKSSDRFGALPEAAEVVPDSAAARAGLKAGDVITEVDGHPVVSMAQVLHRLGPHYEGDKISLKYRRGDKEVSVSDMELVGALAAYAHPFLGILPVRDDPKLGVAVRYVYPKSPADRAGLEAGDRIVKVGRPDGPMASFTGQKPGRDEFFDMLNALRPGMEIKLEIVRKDAKPDGKDDKKADKDAKKADGADKKNDTLTVTLAALPGTSTDEKTDGVPDNPPPASVKQALEPLEVATGKPKPPKVDRGDKKAETGLIKRTTAGGDHKYWVYVHEDYDPNVAHALVVWLHPPRGNSDEDVERFTGMWEDYCKDHHLILVGPQSESEGGWTASEAEPVLAAVREVTARYTIDPQRVVAHGMGVGGQMGFYLGFNYRDVFHGVATLGAVATNVKDNVPSQRLAVYLAGGALDPLVKAIVESRAKLVEHKFPVFYREIPNRGREYFEENVLRELVRWIDALDKQ
jgi:S1-C subfamily serine protease/predicted esterase